jgi:hypothetical protein
MNLISVEDVLASSRASSLPQWTEANTNSVINPKLCGSELARDEARQGNKKTSAKKAPAQPAADRERSGLDEGFLFY